MTVMSAGEKRFNIDVNNAGLADMRHGVGQYRPPFSEAVC